MDYDGCGPACHTEKIRTARVPHVCFECLRDIQPGEQYEYVSGIWDGEPAAYKTCLDCKSIRDTFFISWVYTQVWAAFQDEFGYHDSVVPEACIAELTPGARARVCEFIEAGWE
ncbi:MAG TPA: hypothetical protein DHV36_09560 [Desulfobacteraceae bacterium]|nr:hypothetical protein [Desulfobacteraceae bacterium]|tara:strand:- start:1252 stop:1593 length:342 start_codon:yes stop_codon:yes gene_type:complete